MTACTQRSLRLYHWSTKGDTATKVYVARRIAEGKSSRDAQRCLKRVICRQLFKILERSGPNVGMSLEDLAQAA
jgi:transposase